jgi:hypothetical protein
MKPYVTDLHFESAPNPQTLRAATSAAFDVPVDRTSAGWFLADVTRAAYRNPDVLIVWLQNYQDDDGEFPAPYGLAIEEENADQEVYSENLARLTGTLGISAVMLLQFGKMRLFGPDGSDRIVDWADDNGGDTIRLVPEDRAILAKAGSATHAVT